jgi:hypothetical protein
MQVQGNEKIYTGVWQVTPTGAESPCSLVASLRPGTRQLQDTLHSSPQQLRARHLVPPDT